ncbi:MAG TPA: hypothetical protein VGD11_01790, partial [Mycobacteriales bacterium]
SVLETSLRTSAEALRRGEDPYGLDESLGNVHDETLEDDLDGALTTFAEDDGHGGTTNRSSGRAS